MILTDREIKIAIERGVITIKPRPQEVAFSSTSVDLTLDPVISEFKPPVSGIEQVLDPACGGADHKDIMAAVTQQRTVDEDGYLLQPHKFILGWTTEYVDLNYDARMAARVEGKSSLARIGLAVHITAPTIHAGFNGQIRLEIINHGSLPVRLRRGMRLCQLIFEQTFGTPEQGYRGQFSGQAASG